MSAPFFDKIYKTRRLLYAGLLRPSPNHEGALEEIAAEGYQRVPFRLDRTPAGTYCNSFEVRFPEAPVDWGLMVSIGVYDAATGGNLICNGLLDEPHELFASDIPAFPQGSIEINFPDPGIQGIPPKSVIA